MSQQTEPEQCDSEYGRLRGELNRELAEQTYSRSPVVWRVQDWQIGAVDAVLLGDDPGDAYRVSVTIVGGPEPEVEARIVYPCRECGWASSCGPSGEDCHS